MIAPEQRAEIRRLYYAEHWRLGTIATTLDPYKPLLLGPVLSPYIGTSIIGGSIFLVEDVGYQVSGISWDSFDGDLSFGATSFSVEIDYNYTPTPAVPEPGALALLTTGLGALALVRRLRGSRRD